MLGEGGREREKEKEGRKQVDDVNDQCALFSSLLDPNMSTHSIHSCNQYLLIYI